ncbi:MAG: phosphoribosylanthranilate isomerase [Gammaproteobacteria bacterium]|nr:phosphoribosylanthranilate isomerase [Gammaproteobacteria bacterium]
MSQHRVKIKLCGITSPDQARQAVDLGVDALGMILHADSPRLISRQKAQLIRAEVPAFVSLVGVVVNCPVEQLNRMAQDIGLDLVQLHGDEDANDAERLQVPYIRAIRAKSEQQIAAEMENFPAARAILLDPWMAGVHGGTGQMLDLDLWPRESTKPLVLAGGLNADNIASRVAAVRPFAVDLNSGVEVAPGAKDFKMVAAALAALGR